MGKSILAETQEQKEARLLENRKNHVMTTLNGKLLLAGIKQKDVAEVWGKSRQQTSLLLRTGKISLTQLLQLFNLLHMDEEEISKTFS